MAGIPKLKTRQDRRNINIVVDKEIDDIYRMAKQNGWDASEIARQAVSDRFLSVKDQVKRPAS